NSSERARKSVSQTSTRMLPRLPSWWRYTKTPPALFASPVFWVLMGSPSSAPAAAVAAGAGRDGLASGEVRHAAREIADAPRAVASRGTTIAATACDRSRFGSHARQAQPLPDRRDIHRLHRRSQLGRVPLHSDLALLGHEVRHVDDLEQFPLAEGL